MRRGILIIICIGLCLFTFSAQNPTFSPSDIKVFVDADPPKITILSPSNIAYPESTPILINYTVFDHTLDSIWYSIDFQKNISINSSGFFNLSLPEKKYNLRIYANDSFGRISFTEINFSTSSSSPYCGDGSCSNGESCSNCPDDCGNCVPGSKGGASKKCIPDWKCEACKGIPNKNGTTECRDINNCSSNNTYTQICFVTETKTPETKKEDPRKSRYHFYDLTIFLFLIILIFLLIYIILRIINKKFSLRLSIKRLC